MGQAPMVGVTMLNLRCAPRSSQQTGAHMLSGLKNTRQTRGSFGFTVLDFE